MDVPEPNQFRRFPTYVSAIRFDVTAGGGYFSGWRLIYRIRLFACDQFNVSLACSCPLLYTSETGVLRRQTDRKGGGRHVNAKSSSPSECGAIENLKYPMGRRSFSFCTRSTSCVSLAGAGPANVAHAGGHRELSDPSVAKHRPCRGVA